MSCLEKIRLAVLVGSDVANKPYPINVYDFYSNFRSKDLWKLKGMRLCR
jgi:hypothetical protein